MQMCPVPFSDGKRQFRFLENAFLARKARFSDQPELADAFAVGGKLEWDPFAAKAATKKSQLVLDVSSWDQHSVSAMEQLVQRRAEVDPHFEGILREAKERDITLRHYENARGGVSKWGCMRLSATGELRGEDRYGKILNKTKCIPLTATGLD
jgi:hypothetical protein